MIRLPEIKTAELSTYGGGGGGGGGGGDMTSSLNSLSYCKWYCSNLEGQRAISFC